MILELSHPIVWLVRHVCPIKLNFPFCKGIPLFGALLTVYRGLSDVFIVTVIARNRINGVGSLFFHDRILGFGENMPQSLKRFLSNFNVVAIQNSLDGFIFSSAIESSEDGRQSAFLSKVSATDFLWQIGW